MASLIDRVELMNVINSFWHVFDFYILKKIIYIKLDINIIFSYLASFSLHGRNKRVYYMGSSKRKL